MPKTKSKKLTWEEKISKQLVGRKIVQVRWMTKEEADGLDWHKRPLVMVLDNDTVIYLSADDEGNDGGAMFGQTDKDQLTFPTL